jgi:hypothetical protein
MKKVKIVWIAVFLLSLSQAKFIAQHKQALNKIVEDFRTSVILHNNQEKFSNLFLHDSITWGAIVAGKTKNYILKQKLDFTFKSSNLASFYKKLEDGVEEKFYNVDIKVRGDFATISFDYSFHLKSEIKHWGTEYWSLILVNDSWKISSVTWSMNMEQLEKCPFLLEDLFVLKS